MTTPRTKIVNKIIDDARDCRILALYCLGCDPSTMAPETLDVMDRWRERLIDLDGKLIPEEPKS